MWQVIVASTNPVKMQSVSDGFEQLFGSGCVVVRGVSVPSGVADQPQSSEETLQGATNRCEASIVAEPEADFWVGIEGGIVKHDDHIDVMAWVVVRDRAGRWSRSQTATFALPPAIVDLIHQGYELGVADDMVFGRTNSKHANGSVGLLTHDAINRTQYYSHAVVMALIPFKNPQLYFESPPPAPPENVV